MKSNFLKLCSMMLIGVMLAAVGCTDQIAEDIKGVAGDVDAVEATLSELQSKYNALETAQNDLKALVALKANAADLTAKVAELQDAIAAKAAASDLTALQTKVADLQKALEDAKALLSNYATSDYVAGEVKKLQDQIDALKALKFATPEDVAAVKTAVDGVAADVKALQTKIDAAEKEIDALQAAQAKLEESVKDILSRLEKLEDVDFDSFMTEADVKAWVAENVTPTDLSKVEEEIEAANEAIEAANAVIQNVNAILGELIGSLQKRPQSLVFVPEYSDLAISAYEYTIYDESVNDVVTIKGTYKVSPEETVSLISAGVLRPDMLAKSLKPAGTRAAEPDGVLGELVNVSNFNTTTGTFDVEFVFSNEDVKPGITAIALYLSDEYAVSPFDVDDDMGVATPTMLANTISSEYVAVAFSTNTELEGMFRLVKDGKVYDSAKNAYVFGWDEVKPVTPLEGYEVMIEFETGKYTSLKDAAEMLNVDVKSITPKYADEVEFTDDGAVEPACSVQKVSTDPIAKTLSIAGEITKNNAGDYVKHKVAVTGGFYFGTTMLPTNTVIPVSYSSEIKNREISVNLEPVSIPWSYNLATELSSAKNATTAYDIALDKTKFDALSEVSMEEVVSGYDIKAILDSSIPVTTVNNQTVTGFVFTPTIVAHLDAQIAAVSVEGYKKMWTGEPQKIKSAYNIAADYTDIVVNFELTLGEIPAATSKEYKISLPLTSTGIIEKQLPITKDLGNGLAGFAAGEFDDAVFSSFAPTYEYAIWGEGDEANARSRYNTVTRMTLWDSNPENQKITLNIANDLQHADDIFVYDVEFTPWYYANEYATKNTFSAHVEASVTIPEYSLAPESIWVDENNVVVVPGHTDGGVWVVNDAKLHTYVNVLDVPASSADKLYVKWETTTVANTATGYANIPTPSVTYSAYNASTAILDPAIIEWGAYTALDLDVKATLVMIKDGSTTPTTTNVVAVGEPVKLTLKTNNMINFVADNTYSVQRNGNAAITASFADALSIYGLDASEGSYDYETVGGQRVQKNFIADTWSVDPLYTAAATKYGLDLVFDATTIKVLVDGAEYSLSDVNYSLDTNFDSTGKFTFQSNDAVLNKDVTFVVDAHVTYNRDYNEKNQKVAPTKVTLQVTIKK